MLCWNNSVIFKNEHIFSQDVKFSYWIGSDTCLFSNMMWRDRWQVILTRLWLARKSHMMFFHAIKKQLCSSSRKTKRQRDVDR